MRYLAAATTIAVLAGCPSPTTTNQTATLRNDPPATCSQAQLNACPAPKMGVCADGTMPVIDYSSDCCAHFSCQPVCQSAKVCTRSPAPACPAGTKLWIGTAVEDCCPAYRCEPDGTTTCANAKVACSLALPYCGPGVDPVKVGQTADCCPVYQCPCVQSADATRPADQSMCGCTYPICKPGEQLECRGMNLCGYPCECVPAHGSCTSDSQCAADSRCDLSNCLLPPPVDAGPALCDAAKCVASLQPNVLCPDGKTMSGPTGRCLVSSNGGCAPEIVQCPPAPVECPTDKCGPQLGLASKLCPDGKTTAGPTGRCLLTPEGRCAWEVTFCPVPECTAAECGQAPTDRTVCQDGSIAGTTGRCLRNDLGLCVWEKIACPPTTGCFGVCVPNVQAGCKADYECPGGQHCEVACSGWGCAPSTSTTNACTCPAGDPSCVCDSSGVCKGQECQGKCVPNAPTCSATDKPVACPAIALACPNGAQPAYVGDDPLTCCPVYKCPACAADSNVACAMPDCVCPIAGGTDPNTCCPIYKCGQVDQATGKCL